MKDLQHIGEIIPNVMESYTRRPGTELTRIWDLWGSIVGEVVATHARPEAFKGKLLLVNVSSSTWIHHLQFVKKDIIDQVNRSLGNEAVDDIRFKIGSV